MFVHGATEAEVGHHGDDDGVVVQPAPLVQVDGADGDDLVAVDQLAIVVDGQHPVGVAVEGEAGVGSGVGDLAAAGRRGGSIRSPR